MAKIIKELPKLYGLATSGKIKSIEYRVEVEPDGTANIINVHGYIDGKKQTEVRKVTTGKNIGKSNETTPVEQAILEAESKWRAKLDKNYTENTNGIPDKKEHSLLPMLAKTFDKIDKDGKQVGYKHLISYPCIVQPKLNGQRCITQIKNSVITKTSRKFKPITTMNHLNKDLLDIFGNQKTSPIDGELYIHGMSLQKISRLVKKYRQNESEKVEYWIYDVCNATITNKERNDSLEYYFKNASKDSKVKLVPSYIANNEEEVKAYHDKFVQDGYEGVIVRNLQGKYLFEHRSSDLQKYKEFIDEEFEIVGYKTGEGREEGAIIFVCKVKNILLGGSTTFEVRPRGSIEDRKEWTKDVKNIIGKELTVRYQDLSDSNVPSGNTVGIAIRDYE